MTVFSSGFTKGDLPDSGIFFRARFNLSGEKQDSGTVELGWRDGRSELDRDLEIAIELFCACVSEASERMRSRVRSIDRAKSKGPFVNLPG